MNLITGSLKPRVGGIFILSHRAFPFTGFKLVSSVLRGIQLVFGLKLWGSTIALSWKEYSKRTGLN
jgi:hypothetical protein